MFTFWLFRITFRCAPFETPPWARGAVFWRLTWPLAVEILFWFGRVVVCCTPLCLILAFLLLTLLAILEPDLNYLLGCRGSFVFSAVLLAGWGLAEGLVGMVSMVPEATLSFFVMFAICLLCVAWLLVCEPLIAGFSELSFVLMDKFTPARADWLNDLFILSTDSFCSL